jgi:hypothetical protein
MIVKQTPQRFVHSNLLLLILMSGLPWDGKRTVMIKVHKLAALSTVLLGTCTISLTGWAQNAPNAERLAVEAKTAKLPYSHMALRARLIGPAISDPNWYNWCVSPIMGDDGKVHIFGARWPKADGMGGWTGPRAQIAHFVGDEPEGPFRYIGTVLRTDRLPDPASMAGPHNPRLERVDGKYVLLFIAQNPPLQIKGQRILMAIAQKLEGPWTFAGDRGVVVQPSKDPHHWTYQAAIGVDNPAFLKIGKKYYIYFKSGMPEQMKAKYGYAVSDQLEGPYVLSDHPITDNTSYIEDAQAFSTGGQYFLLTTDNLGGNTGVYGDIILWRSKTGLRFELSDAKIAMGNILDYWGTEEQHRQLAQTPGHFDHDPSGKLERPAILQIGGRPAYFYSTADLNINAGGVAESYVFKIEWDGTDLLK